MIGHLKLHFSRWIGLAVILSFLTTQGVFESRSLGQNSSSTNASESALADYFKLETAKISNSCLTDITSLADWQARRVGLRQQAAAMLGLDPMPERTELKTVVTGKLEQDTFTVEKLYFQSRPHLYVTANLYVPKGLTKPAPTVLYLCGHTAVVTNGVSYGNKTAYQQHPIWFARNGYVCLAIDTLQWGEIRGVHDGTYAKDYWWWNSRGYTPAGVETWDAIRALDYLDSRPEVDTNRIGVTGRSGGGAYSWFLAALDDRVKVIAPVAGITDLENYVVDGAVDHHCDCMFLVNTYRWDYPLLAALCAPRPLLLANSDTDIYFPLTGVTRTHDKVQQIYNLYGASNNFAMVIGPGPHRDTPEMQVPVFRWFDEHLKQQKPVTNMPAVKLFSPQELRVFDKIPDDQINTAVQESFVAAAPEPAVPGTSEAWQKMRGSWLKQLKENCFAGWPAISEPPAMKQLFSVVTNGIEYSGYEYESQPAVPLRLYLMRNVINSRPDKLILRVAESADTNFSTAEAPELDSKIVEAWNTLGTRDEGGRRRQDASTRGFAYAVCVPRCVGFNNLKPARLAQIRRRFMLLGQTLDGMRVWDIRRSIQTLRVMPGFSDAPLYLEGEGEMGVNALYASLFEPGIKELDLRGIPSTQRAGPDYLNVLRVLDLPETVAMAAESQTVHLQSASDQGWEFPKALAKSSAAKLNLDFVK